MNHESDLKHESVDEKISIADEREPRQARKPWITPVVTESPVNELTAANPTFTPTPDGAFLYS